MTDNKIEHAVWSVGRLQELAETGNPALAAKLRRWNPASAVTDATILSWMNGIKLTEWDMNHPQVPAQREIALLATGSLMATHMQKSHANPMENGIPFASAVGRLAYRKGPGIIRRFTTLLNAKSFATTFKYMQTLTTLIGASGMTVDYLDLADDLVKLQGPYRKQVIAKWSRLYARVTPDDADSPTK